MIKDSFRGWVVRCMRLAFEIWNGYLFQNIFSERKKHIFDNMLRMNIYLGIYSKIFLSSLNIFSFGWVAGESLDVCGWHLRGSY